MNPIVEELNNKIKKLHPTIFDMLPSKGKNFFFPSKGILGQTAEAKGKKIDATIGAALEDDGSLMHYEFLQDIVQLHPSQIFSYAPSVLSMIKRPGVSATMPG